MAVLLRQIFSIENSAFHVIDYVESSISCIAMCVAGNLKQADHVIPWVDMCGKQGIYGRRLEK